MDMATDTPWALVLSVSVFVIANILCIRSARLLSFVTSREQELFSASKDDIKKLRATGLRALCVTYVVIAVLYLLNRYLATGFFALDFWNFLGRVFIYLISNSKEIGTLLMMAAIPPTAISMFNFVLAAAMLGQFGRVAADTPSPIIGFFGAFLGLVTLLGSVASIWSWGWGSL